MEEFKTVFRAANTIEAHTMCGFLEQANCDVRLLGEHLQGAVGELPMDALEIRVQVIASQEKKAKTLIEEALKSAAGADWFCPHCQEKNAASFDLCWSCQTDKPTER